MRIFEARILRRLLWIGLLGGVIAAVGVLSVSVGILPGGPWFGLLALWLVPSLWALDRVPLPGAGVVAGLVGGAVVGFVWPAPYWPALVYSVLYATAVEAVFLVVRYRRSSIGLSAVAGGVGGAAIVVHWVIAWVSVEDGDVFAPIVGGLAVGTVVALVLKQGRRSAASVEST
ncbi:hypothetical protein FVA95_02010 [Pseudonocardia sp. EV170527-09]|uniref:hypothetical protein n=1 Tax=Pseudonocardia sp. EV170527-09 TaxID=2603411 RepID=UPI0011F34F03|nr:hypothetical protein [Pseudonocardia sp. EV170527-09]KAA1035463.1 hypothetical protein FVA95_02010 [Pseudonocardia sp. EV170527-09]